LRAQLFAIWFRQPNVDGGAFVDNAADGNLAAVCLDNRFRHRQADTICLQITLTFEKFQQGRYRFGRNPATGIGNSQHYVLVDGIDGRREGATP
jgi:hypothetical protein